MEQWTWACQHQCFQLGFAQELPSSFVVIAPDVYHWQSLHKESYQLGSHLLRSSVFLPSTKSKTTASTGSCTVRIDVTNVTKVGLNQDFQAFFVCQSFLCPKRAFSSADRSLTRLGSSAEYAHAQLTAKILDMPQPVHTKSAGYTIFKVRYLTGEWMTITTGRVTKPNSSLLHHIKNLMSSQLDLGFFKFRYDIVVVGVEPFLLIGRHDTFRLTTTSQGEIPLQVRQFQALHRWRYHVKEKGCIQYIVIMRKVIWLESLKFLFPQQYSSKLARSLAAARSSSAEISCSKYFSVVNFTAEFTPNVGNQW